MSDVKLNIAIAKAIINVIIDEKKGGNPFPENKHVPPGNRPQAPTGKGTNAGPENIGNPGDLDNPGGNFKPPKLSGFKTALIMGAAIGSTLRDNLPSNKTPEAKDNGAETPPSMSTYGPKLTNQGMAVDPSVR